MEERGEREVTREGEGGVEGDRGEKPREREGQVQRHPEKKMLMPIFTKSTPSILTSAGDQPAAAPVPHQRARFEDPEGLR